MLRDWFHLRDECPACGRPFELDDSFYGAYFLSLCFILSVLFVVCMVFLIVKNAVPTSSYVPALVAAVVVAIVVPLAFYPFSRTLWVAIEVALTSDDPVAEAEAVLAASQHPHNPTGDPLDDPPDEPPEHGRNEPT